jgi:hypothetical protein
MAAWLNKHTFTFFCQNVLGSDKREKKSNSDNLVLHVMMPFNVFKQLTGCYHLGSQGYMTIEHTYRTNEMLLY